LLLVQRRRGYPDEPSNSFGPKPVRAAATDAQFAGYLLDRPPAKEQRHTGKLRWSLPQHSSQPSMECAPLARRKSPAARRAVNAERNRGAALSLDARRHAILREHVALRGWAALGSCFLERQPSLVNEVELRERRVSSTPYASSRGPEELKRRINVWR